MGRTNPTYRDALRAMESRWEDYRRALRRADQQVFDRLFEAARVHADASGLQNHQFVEIPASSRSSSNSRNGSTISKIDSTTWRTT